MDCIEELAQKNVDAREEEILAGVTHIIESRDYSREGEAATARARDLYRADGMLIGSQQGDIVRYGDDIGTAKNHMFRTDADAQAWLRRLADIDCYAQDIEKPMHECIYDQVPRGLAKVQEIDGGVKVLAGPNMVKPVSLIMPGLNHGRIKA